MSEGENGGEKVRRGAYAHSRPLVPLPASYCSTTLKVVGVGIVRQLDYALAMPSIDCCRHISPVPISEV